MFFNLFSVLQCFYLNFDHFVVKIDGKDKNLHTM